MVRFPVARSGGRSPGCALPKPRIDPPRDKLSGGGFDLLAQLSSGPQKRRIQTSASKYQRQSPARGLEVSRGFSPLG